MILKLIKLKIIFIVIFFLFTSLLYLNTACGLKDQTLEKTTSVSQDKSIESEINRKITELNISKNVKSYLIEVLQNEPYLFDNINTEHAFWEWLVSNQSATSVDIDNAIRIAAKDKFYSAGFIDNLLELDDDELSELLADDVSLEEKHREYLDSVPESFFNNDIVFYIDRQTYLSYFPEDTKELIYLSEELHASVKKVIIKAIEVYPLGFVPQHLKKLYIIGNKIKTEEVDDVSAIVVGKTIFITNGELDDEILYLPVFHHSFNHLLQKEYKEFFESYYEEWISINPEGFKYFGHEPYYSGEDKTGMYEDGFISSYSLVDYSEDFAEIASYAFSKDPIFFDAIVNYPRIKQKFELMLEFYNKIDSGISLDYLVESGPGQETEKEASTENNSGPETEREVAIETPVEIVEETFEKYFERVFRTEVDDDMFPYNWYRNPINAKAESLSPEKVIFSKEAILNSLQKYPNKILADNLSRVYLLNSINFFDLAYGGNYQSEFIFIGVYEYDDIEIVSANIEETFHHEFSSILFENYNDLFKKETWKKINSEQFEYSYLENESYRAIIEKKSSLNLDPDLHKVGFLYEYAMATLQNDFNSFANYLFTDYQHFWDAIKEYPRLKEKLDQTIIFYLLISKEFEPLFKQQYNKYDLGWVLD